jgi:hypothetical protein
MNGKKEMICGSGRNFAPLHGVEVSDTSTIADNTRVLRPGIENPGDVTDNSLPSRSKAENPWS